MRLSIQPLVLSLLGAVALGVLVGGCKPQTDLGQPCILVRKDPADTDPSDGIRSIPLHEKDITPGKDYVSFGSTDCDDLVCVRDANTQPGDSNAEATGFCSRSCIQTSETTCQTGDNSVDRSNPFTCRSLILDENTLAAIKQNNPELYRQYFGQTESPYFCALPQSEADAGS